MTPEPRRHLDLDRIVDREHLITGMLVSDSERMSRRWAALPDTAASDRSREPAMQVDAETAVMPGLVGQIMTNAHSKESHAVAGARRGTNAPA